MTTIQVHLTPREAQDVIDLRRAQISPSQPPGRPPGVRPLSVMIGGTPGTGKTMTVQALIQESLGGSSFAVSDLDDDLPAHPRYDAIMRAYGLEATQAIRRSLPSDLGHRCLEHLRSLQYDVISCAPGQEESSTKAWVDGFRQADYRTVFVYVVTNEANSDLGRADRYVRSCDDVGYGRWSDPDFCIRCNARIPDTAHAIEAASDADHLYAVDRNAYVLYENHRGDNGLMPPPFRVDREILAEYNRPPTPEEHEWFVATARPLLNRNDLAPPVAGLVQRAWDKHAQRPAPQPLTREHRLDERLIDLRRITTSGVAPPQVITSTTSGTRTSAGRTSDGRSLDR